MFKHVEFSILWFAGDASMLGNEMEFLPLRFALAKNESHTFRASKTLTLKIVSYKDVFPSQLAAMNAKTLIYVLSPLLYLGIGTDI